MGVGGNAMKTILFVDDEKYLRMLYEREFAQDGYRVLTADSGADALGVLRREPVDIAVVDIRMPGMSGLELMDEMLAARRDLPVILNTAFSSYKDNFQSWLAEAYVVKSSDLSELKNKVADVLARPPI